jgi:phosphopentomutase
LGDEHVKTGKPIIYTSSDSVFQIAMHEDIIPIEEQYHICRLAREMLTEDLEVGRVIARPFIGKAGQYQRTSRRKDFAIMPPYNMLNAIVDDGKSVLAIGKISDIFAGSGISESVKTDNNAEGMKATIQAMDSFGRGLIFTNLVDFDMHYGHRRDVEGYALCLEEFDTFLPKLFSKLEGDDLLIVTADHGNDPTWHGTDHTREYIPILIYNRLQQTSINFGIRNSFADIAATVLDALGTKFATDSIAGESISYIW